MKDQAKILVVEDQVIAQKIALFVLSTLGCEVDLAHSGEEALELFQKNHYDLILMDVGLPDIDGLAVTRSIRNKEDKLNSTPVIALTAHSNELTRLEAVEAGTNGFLENP